MKRLGALARSLEARAALVLLLSVLLMYAGEQFLVRHSVVSAADEVFASEVAKQVALAREAVLRRPRPERSSEARALSTSHFEIGWSEQLPLEGTTDRNLATLRDRVLELDSSLTNIILKMEHPNDPLHQLDMSGALALPDGSWLTFRSAHSPSLIQQGLWGHLSLAMVVLVVLSALALVHWIGRPLRELVRTTNRMGQGEVVPVAETGPDEIRGIARALNNMQEHIQRLISARTQALAAVSHDLRTPIARMRLRLDAVAEQDQRALMASDLDEMQSMIDSTLAYLREETDPERRQVVNVASILMSVADGFADAGSDVTYEGPARVTAGLRPTAFRRAVANLADNAVRYGKRARLTLAHSDASLTVTIDDDGAGLSEEEVLRAFEPFVRLDASRNRNAGGTGLGLTIARQVVVAEGGTITVASRAEGGLRAMINLPRNTVPMG